MKRRSEAIHFAVPGALDQATGGYRYDAAIVAGLRALGHEVVVHELAGRFPLADAPAVAAARAALKKIGRGRAVIDGLALPAFAGLLGGKRRIAGLVHHPLWLESGMARRTADELRRLESGMLKQLATVIVTSQATRLDVMALGVDPGSIAVVEPGTAPGAVRWRGAGVARLLSVGTLTPRKAHDLLLRALAKQRHRGWRLICAGSVTRNVHHARALRALVTRLRLGARVRFTGEVPPRTLARLYAGSDLFILPSLHEGYGMAFAEALARGVPVVGSHAGALSDVVPRPAGILVPPGRVTALSSTLRLLLGTSHRRERLARGAFLRRRYFPGWPAQVRRFLRALPS
ncbi:MAG: glycosyltransferase family 4 protein [Alphaproteobacteria bacterium]|nr:glycosyltransferase family 4 protein [Alphaproteobacteria bacterium]